MPLKFVTVNDSVSASGGLRPLGPPPGLRPWTLLGDFYSQVLLACAVPKFPLKIPHCWHLSLATSDRNPAGCRIPAFFAPIPNSRIGGVSIWGFRNYNKIVKIILFDS